MAQYTIINLSNGERTELVDGGLPVQLAVWAPTDNALVYVFQSNIYYRSSVSTKDVVQITATIGTVSNGVPDWVYEGKNTIVLNVLSKKKLFSNAN